MKILHIGNTAGVASTLAKYVNRQFEAICDVITLKSFDPFGVTVYGQLWDCPTWLFKVKSVLKAHKYDIIHVHSLEGIGKFIKKVYPYKKLVMHFHGSDIRGKWREKEHYWKKADAILVSTEDLLEDAPSEALYLPNPVDTELFYPRQAHERGTAFTFSYNADDLAKKMAASHNLKLTIHNRNINPILHTELPNVLSLYEYYIDVRRLDGKIIKNLSKTSLEALACGCKTILWNTTIVDNLTEEHKPQKAAERLYTIYQSLL